MITLQACEFHDHIYESFVVGESNPSAGSDSEEESGVDLNANVQVFFNESAKGALVELTIYAKPVEQPSWSARVTFVGHFVEHEHAVMPLEKFAWSNGIAYLVPFVRERLSSITSASAFSTFLLPPLSVPSILRMARVGAGDTAKIEAAPTDTSVEAEARPAKRKPRGKTL